MLWINHDVLFVATEDLHSLLECLITVRSTVGNNLFLELFKACHVGVHGNNVHQKFFWLKMEPLWVLNLELKTLLGCKLIKAEIKSLGKFLTELLTDKWFLAVSGNLGKKLDDHV